ncbi:hypothetical protein [Methanococcoides methylutens]|uniref:hypothetical protein n=1 Tax=Methanococcoides methylutens TaxID=2226 RepID=UPI0012E014B4|nr:hypothetical protein [Methanococcoides methylutens]
MSLEIGFLKYVVKTPLTSKVGYVSMYLFGGTVLTFFNTISELFSGNFVNAFLEYFVYSALPPTSLSNLIVQPIVGSVVAGISWYIAMSKR